MEIDTANICAYKNWFFLSPVSIFVSSPTIFVSLPLTNHIKFIVLIVQVLSFPNKISTHSGFSLQQFESVFGMLHQKQCVFEPNRAARDFNIRIFIRIFFCFYALFFHFLFVRIKYGVTKDNIFESVATRSTNTHSDVNTILSYHGNKNETKRKKKQRHYV